MPLTTARSWSGLAPITAVPGAAAAPLSDAQTAVMLSYANWRTQSLILSGEPPIRHLIAGILVEAALRDPPLPVWVYMLAKLLVREPPDGESEIRDAHARADSLKPHIDLLEARGDAATHIDRHRRRVVQATPQLIRKVKRALDLQVRFARAAVAAIDYLDAAPAAPTRHAPDAFLIAAE